MELEFRTRNLSTQHGGYVFCKSYCRMFRYRPQSVRMQMLCSGGKFWAPCVDYLQCRLNKPRPPAPVVVLRALEKEGRY